MVDFFIVVFLLAFIATVVCLVVFLARWILRKSKKEWGIATLGFFGLLLVCGVAMTGTACKGEYIEISRVDPTCTAPGEILYQCSECGETKTEPIPPLGHQFVEVSRDEPTADSDGKVVERCSRCGEEVVTTLEQLSPEHEADPPTEDVSQTNDEPAVETSPVSFSDIYREFKANELRAEEKYQFNRYQITARVNGMSTSGVLNLTGGATLTMETTVDDTIVFFHAEFEKEQEQALKAINVGDTVTFEGKCLSAGSWSECELIQ